MSDEEARDKMFKSRGIKKRGAEKCLANIIAELNRNLKKNTHILTEMKESLSNLSTYKEGYSSSQSDISATQDSTEQTNKFSEGIDFDQKHLFVSKNNLKELEKEQNIVSNEKVRVETRIVFLKLGEIDTVKEQFQAEVFIEAKWKEPNLKIEVNISLSPCPFIFIF